MTNDTKTSGPKRISGSGLVHVVVQNLRVLGQLSQIRLAGIQVTKNILRFSVPHECPIEATNRSSSQGTSPNPKANHKSNWPCCHQQRRQTSVWPKVGPTQQVSHLEQLLLGTRPSSRQQIELNWPCRQAAPSVGPPGDEGRKGASRFCFVFLSQNWTKR